MARFDCRCIASWACFSNNLQGADAGILILRNGKNAQPHSLQCHKHACDLEDWVRTASLEASLEMTWFIIHYCLRNNNGDLVDYKLK